MLLIIVQDTILLTPGFKIGPVGDWHRSLVAKHFKSLSCKCLTNLLSCGENNKKWISAYFSDLELQLVNLVETIISNY